jgi:hypothetical protein
LARGELLAKGDLSLGCCVGVGAAHALGGAAISSKLKLGSKSRTRCDDRLLTSHQYVALDRGEAYCTDADRAARNTSALLRPASAQATVTFTTKAMSRSGASQSTR